MPELTFLRKEFISPLSIDEIKKFVTNLEGPEIFKKSVSDEDFKLVTKANDHFGYGLIFSGTLETTDGGTSVTIRTETRHDFFLFNLIFGGLILAIVIFDKIQINGQLMDFSNRLFHAMGVGLVTFVMNAYLVFQPVNRFNKKLIRILKGT